MKMTLFVFVNTKQTSDHHAIWSADISELAEKYA